MPHLPPRKPVTFKSGVVFREFDDPCIRYRDHITTANVIVPSRCDYTAKVPAWPMYLNNEIGDCSIAGAAHAQEVWSTYGSGKTFEASNTDVLQAYCAVSGYNPATGQNDTGAVLQNVLTYWSNNPVAGPKISAFAKVSFDPGEMRDALYFFGCLYIGVALPQSAETQFNSGQDWTLVGDQPVGGHCIILTGYDENGWTGITWGRPVHITNEWLQHYLMEAWVIVSPFWTANNTDPVGVNLQSLGDEWESITGQPNPFAPAVTTSGTDNVLHKILRALENAATEIESLLKA